MPSFLLRGPHIQITAAGKCFGKRKSSGQREGRVFKDVTGWGRAFVWPVYNLAHFYNRETPKLWVFDPHRQREACWLGGFLVFQAFYCGCEGKGRQGRRGWHVAGETAGCLPTGSVAAAGAVIGEHTCHSVMADIIFFVFSMWIMNSTHIHCQHVILCSMLPHMLTLAFHDNSLIWIVVSCGEPHNIFYR